MKINNYDEIFEELKEQLKNLTKELRPYQVDLYMAVENGSAKIFRFENVGGNSQLVGGDSFRIYQHPGTDEDLLDAYLAGDDLRDPAYSFLFDGMEFSEEEKEDFKFDCKTFCRANNSIMEKIEELYFDYIDNDCDEFFTNKADEILNNAEIFAA